MLMKQRGATLLEAILVAAIMGWVLAYAGTQLKKYALNQQIGKSTRMIVHINNEIKDYVKTYHLPVTSPDANGNNYVVNPLLTQSGAKTYWHSGNLYWMKSESCASKGLIPANVRRVYFPCEYSTGLFGLILGGVYFEFIRYSNLAFPNIHRYPRNGWSLYVNESNKEIGDFFSIATRISDVYLGDGKFITEERISIGEYTPSSSGIWTEVAGTSKPLTDLIGGDLVELNDYIKRVTSNGNYAGMKVPIIYENDPEEIYLKADGTIAVGLNDSLCWNSNTGNKKPCIRAVTDNMDKANSLVVEGGLAFGSDKKRTPLHVSYHTFINNQPVLVPYLKCPNNVNDLVMNNKMAAISSSFSSGSENATSFVDSSNIVSKGTKGADGKHAMLSGISLEWTAANSTDTNPKWHIEGSVAIDGAYKTQNSNTSVLRNPKSISFIVMQWCEE